MNELTPEDITYLKIKWGRSYKPDEWIQLEKLYTDMMESYDMTKGNKTFYVRLYYPQSTGEISDVDVQNRR